MRDSHPSTIHRDGIVIAGGGLAGQRCAETLRRHGYDGAITIVCGEPRLPYDRPPLSKGILTGEHAESRLPYRQPPWYEGHRVQPLLGVRAVRLNPARRRLHLSDGGTLAYDWLLVATGSRPRTVPLLTGYPNVSCLRTLDDALALRAVLAARPRLAIVGAGFIGQEVAAAARTAGAAVTMIEAAQWPLHRILGPDLGRWFARLHRSQGVDVITGCTAERVQSNGSGWRLRLSSGRIVEADHVVVGVGVAPETAWLAESAIAAANGIPVDGCGRTCAKRVLAAGDVAAIFDPTLGSYVPGSHWESAGAQGARAAKVMLGIDPGMMPVTSFWTDQYGLRIQYLGHARAADSVEIDGDPTARSFTATFKRAGRPVAALLVDRPRQLPAARKMIESKGAK